MQVIYLGFMHISGKNMTMYAEKDGKKIKLMDCNQFTSKKIFQDEIKKSYPECKLIWE